MKLGEDMTHKQFTAIIEREADGFVALCAELDVASQGSTIEEARNNLVEAIELFLEHASTQEVLERLSTEVFITQVSVAIA
jgi:predicted RNase H-like HicB family nuclease